MEEKKIDVAEVVPEATNEFPPDPVETGTGAEINEETVEEIPPVVKKKLNKKFLVGVLALLIAVGLGITVLTTSSNDAEKVNNDKTPDKETATEVAVKNGDLDEIQMELTNGEFIQYESGGKPIDTLSLVKFTNLTDKDAELDVKADKETIDPSKEGDIAVKYTVTSDDTQAEFSVIFSVVKDVAAAQNEARSQQTSYASGSGTATARTPVTNRTTTVNGSNGTWTITTTSRRPSSTQKTADDSNATLIQLDEPAGNTATPTGTPGTKPIIQGGTGPNTDNNSGSSNSSSSNSGGSSSQTPPPAAATQPTQPSQPAQHVHNWVPITTTIHHDAITHVVHHDAVYNQQYVVDSPAQYGNMIVCITCGAQYGSLDEFLAHSWDETNGEHGNYTVKNVMISEETGHYENVLVSGAWDETVTDQAAWDEPVTTGYQCSECGATQ